MRQVYEKVKNIVINPWYAMFFMLIISYFSLCRFFYNGLSPFRKVILIWGIFLLCYGSVKKRYVIKNKYSILLFPLCVTNGITVLIIDKERFMNRFHVRSGQYVSPVFPENFSIVFHRFDI